MLDPGPQIVGIGASAGGVQVLQDFFDALPAHTGAAFVVVMHLDPDARSEMVAILAKRTPCQLVRSKGPCFWSETISTS